MKPDKNVNNEGLLNYIETVSGEIQLLALNIAVAAAKLAHNQKIGEEVNQNLSNLVNQATQAVKQMNLVIDAAKTDKKPTNFFTDIKAEPVDQELIEDIEIAMGLIVKNSEKIVRLLAEVKTK